MTDHPDRLLEARFAERIRRDLDAGLPGLDPAAANVAARALGGTGRRHPIVAIVTVLAAAALTVGALQLLPAGGGPASASPDVSASATAASTPSAAATGADAIIRVAQGERVQAVPATEELAQAFDLAYQFAQEHPDDTGYPWLDPSSGDLVLSAATAQGRSLLESEAAGLSVPARIRDVAHSFAELQRIQDDVTRLRAEGVVDAELIHQTSPDHRDNRTLITMSADSPALIEALAERFPADAIAVRIAPG
jgi:hypothetical protein